VPAMYKAPSPYNLSAGKIQMRSVVDGIELRYAFSFPYPLPLCLQQEEVAGSCWTTGLKQGKTKLTRTRLVSIEF
jgi:hypothetical protein